MQAPFDAYCSMSALTMKGYLTKMGVPGRSESINAKYTEELRKLTTEQLNLILEVHHKGKQFRHGSTIETIMTELFERATNPETRDKHEKGTILA